MCEETSSLFRAVFELQADREAASSPFGIPSCEGTFGGSRPCLATNVQHRRFVQSI
jgi:hypothetical protein